MRDFATRRVGCGGKERWCLSEGQRSSGVRSELRSCTKVIINWILPSFTASSVTPDECKALVDIIYKPQQQAYMDMQTRSCSVEGLVVSSMN